MVNAENLNELGEITRVQVLVLVDELWDLLGVKQFYHQLVRLHASTSHRVNYLHTTHNILLHNLTVLAPQQIKQMVPCRLQQSFWVWFLE